MRRGRKEDSMDQQELFKCKSCEAYFKSQNELQNHEEEMHQMEIGEEEEIWSAPR